MRNRLRPWLSWLGRQSNPLSVDDTKQSWYPLAAEETSPEAADVAAND